ncbi:MAG: potassium-transporting ATPase subunit KdpA [Myxococcales bacterium]|nr:potassium-transporting ATPase subunit KdpA [Myxococcales bacterium]
MTVNGWLQILVFSGLVLAATKPLGVYMHRVFEGERQPMPRILGALERSLLRLCGVDAREQHDAREYGTALLLFSVFGLLAAYLVMRLQHLLPLNPEEFDAVPAELAWNTAVSFTTNTNWQAYAGESTMSYLTQMLALTWHNFVSASVGFCVALALARGLTRTTDEDGGRSLGNFWVDLVRGLVYVLLPLAIVTALLLASQGVIQNFSPYVAAQLSDGGSQSIAMGPVASQEAIKMLGVNGGGFFNANSAHPFENPNGLTNLLEMFVIFLIPAGLTYMFGRMAKDTRQGWALFATMSVLFLLGTFAAYAAESAGHPMTEGNPQIAAVGNLEGKEVRFGIAASSLFAVVTTDASCGAVNSMHDSYTPLGGLVLLLNMQLGEVVFGGIGVGLTGMLVFAILAVFIAGLMVGRTPEYLGKKIEQREMKIAMLYVLIFPLSILAFSAWAASVEYATSSRANLGPHGLSEIIYAYSSATGNNGSAFAGLNANTPFYNVTIGIAMLLGRFFMLVPVIAIAGSIRGKPTVPPGPGTFPTNSTIFVILLVAVVMVVGALTFFPVLCLAPVVEHFLGGVGRVF